MGDDRSDDGDSEYLWNVGKLLPEYTTLQPRQPSSYLVFVLRDEAYAMNPT
jgi:hypothetical protein